MRSSHSAVLLPDECVFAIGGTATPDFYIPATGTLTAASAPPLVTDVSSVTLLAGGQVLVADSTTTTFLCITATAALHRPSSGMWPATGCRKDAGYSGFSQ